MRPYLKILCTLSMCLILVAGCAAPPAPTEPPFTPDEGAQATLVNVPVSTPNGEVVITFDENAMPIAITIQNPTPEIQTLRLEEGQAIITLVLPPEAPVGAGQTVTVTLVPVSTTLNPDGTIFLVFQGTVAEFPLIAAINLVISGTADTSTTPPTLTGSPPVTATAPVNTLFGPLLNPIFSVPLELSPTPTPTPTSTLL